uniref:ABC transporter ATP-binding protein n=1 Tax=Congregicoccus parvus TaxID=3081749 RepID=UPI002B309700|nr:ABC transporter ATP-binding protein [Opitutales bacterium ASA1]
MSFASLAGLPTHRDRLAAGEKPRGTLQWSTVRRVLGFTRPYAAKRNAVFAFTILRAIQKPALAWCIGAVINGPITGGNWHGAIVGACAYLALAVFTELTFHFRQRLALEMGEAVVHDLRAGLFAHLQRMPLAFYHKTKLGRILSRFITDIEAVRRGVQQVFFFSLLLFGQMLGAAVLMAWNNLVLFLVLLVLAPFFWAAQRYFHPRIGRSSRAVAESQSRLTGFLAESVRGMRVIHGFSRQERNDADYARLVERHADNNVELAGHSALYVPLLDLNNQLFLAILLVVGGFGATQGWEGMEVGDVIAFFFLANLFFQPLQHVAQLNTQAIVSMAGAERVFQMLDTQPEWEDEPDAIDLPRGAGAGAAIEFRHVGFAYEPGRPVLHDVSFSAQPGQMVALVGHTGSGKSTIASLAAKFHLPAEGEILIDGVDLRRVRSESVRRCMGIVLQSNFLFGGSVMDNIRLGRPDAGDDDVRAAAAAIDCLDLLEALPQGLLTEVGERGSALSLGQRQLVCFARAMLSDPRILVLDEATSAIDTITESRLQQALGKLVAGRTSLVVAHRLSTIRTADLILVLEHGRIVERGSHRELLLAGGRYHDLYRQFLGASSTDGAARN